MKAYIKGTKDMFVVHKVKWRTIDPCGLVRIKDEYGVLFETHLCNVVFVDECLEEVEKANEKQTRY